MPDADIIKEYLDIKAEKEKQALAKGNKEEDDDWASHAIDEDDDEGDEDDEDDFEMERIESGDGDAVEGDEEDDNEDLDDDQEEVEEVEQEADKRSVLSRVILTPKDLKAISELKKNRLAEQVLFCLIFFLD